MQTPKLRKALQPVKTAQVRVDDVAGCLAKPARKRVSDAETKGVIKARLKARHAA